MKEDKSIEQILLNDEKYENFINEKTEKEFTQLLEEKSKSEKDNITDIKKVPKDLLFSRQATYLVINKASKTQSFINGIQADGFIGDKNILREKLISGITSSFVSGNNYIKFFNLEA